MNTNKNTLDIINNIDPSNTKDLIYNEEDKKCAPGKIFESGSCISLNDFIAMAEAYNEENKNNMITMHPSFETLNRSKYKLYLVKEFKKRLSNVCDSQQCWTTQLFIKKMKNKMQMNTLQKHTFRPIGPQGKFEWLNTININDVMEQYEKKYLDFKWLGAVPIDFDDIKRLKIKEMNFDLLAKTGKNKIGIIFNLDESWKGGSHWVASFANLKEGQVYFFDSYGTQPPKRIRTYLRRVATYCQSKLKINVEAEHNKVRHQYDGSECGVYSLNFILRLLKGETFKKICDSKTPDKEINKCRKVYFGNNK